MTCLQLALDDPDLETAVIRARELADLVDIVEVGTPLVIEYGMEAVRRLREGCPGVEILADLKIMDAGRLEASLAFAAGASWVTVLGMAHDTTIRAALAAAAEHDGKLMVDLIGCPDIKQRAGELAASEVDVFCVHAAWDAQATGADPLADLASLLEVVEPGRAAVAGGITPATLPAVRELGPAIVVIGGFLAGHSRPREAAAELRGVLVGGESVA